MNTTSSPFSAATPREFTHLEQILAILLGTAVAVLAIAYSDSQVTVETMRRASGSAAQQMLRSSFVDAWVVGEPDWAKDGSVTVPIRLKQKKCTVQLTSQGDDPYEARAFQIKQVDCPAPGQANPG